MAFAGFLPHFLTGVTTGHQVEATGEQNEKHLYLERVQISLNYNIGRNTGDNVNTQLNKYITKICHFFKHLFLEMFLWSLSSIHPAAFAILLFNYLMSQL